MSVGCKLSCRSRSVSRPPHSRSEPAGWTGSVIAGAIGGAALLVPGLALAAEPALAFSVPAQPLGDALVSFGLQAGVSVGVRDLDRCGRLSRPVIGRYTPAAALTRLLAGSRCEFEAVDARAYSVRPRPPAPASEPPPPATVEPATEASLLSDVTVTTTRRPSLVSRTPASVSVASGDALAAARIDSLQDLASEFAGVTVTNLGPGRNKVFVRGLSDGAFTGRTQSTVGLYLDDVPITYSAPDPDLRLVDVERVELMRGPQGSLYGVGSIGGIVRIVTKKPDLDALTFGAAAGAASTQSGAASYSLDAVANVPIAPGRLAIRGVAYSDTIGGYVDDVALSVQNANRTRRMGARLAATAVISPDWRLTIGATRQSLRSDDSQYTQGGLGLLQRNTRVLEPHHNDFTQGYVSVDGAGSWGRLRLSAAYLGHDFDTRYEASAGLVVFEPRGDYRTFDQANRVRLAVAEAVLTSNPGRRLQWLAGVFASRTTENLRYNLSAFEAVRTTALYLESRRDRNTEAAVYGEIGYALTRRLNLTAGARAFSVEVETRSDRTQGVVTRSFSGRFDTQGLSPKLVLSWQAAPSKLFYLQAAQGYRTGGFNTTGRVTQQFNAGATGNQPNRQYAPDRLWSYEAGAKAALGERLQLRAAAFYNDWRDVQSDQFLPSGLPYTANVGRAVNIGFEGEGALRVGRALSLRLSFLLNSPQLRQRDETYPSRPNASLPAVPRYSAALIADWRREVATGLEVVLYGRIAYVGASILTFQEQASSVMGNYATARLAAGLETRRWRLTAFVDNPANTVGDTFAFGDPFTQGRVPQSTPLRPRTMGVTLAMGL